MGFCQTSAHAIEPGQPTTAHFDRQSERLQAPIQCPSRRVHRTGILEGCFGLSEKTRKHLWLLRKECPYILRAFRCVAWLTSQTQVADAVGPPVGFGLNVLNLQGHPRSITVRTCAVPLLE